MSADLLRRAAALMRERAEAATTTVLDDEGKWVVGPWFGPLAMSSRRVASEADSAFIASWHPAVALAVADWLEQQAMLQEAHDTGKAVWIGPADPLAIAVARAYLNEPPT